MKILLVHNFYQQAGGEDVVFEAERSMLVAAGHTVETYTVSNDDLKHVPALKMAIRTVWNAEAARTLAELVRRQNIDVVHFHNTFPMLSPAVYQAVRAAGAAAVQTLHNYRLVCANALLYRDDRPCEDCLGVLPWPAIKHRCYRESLAASATVAGTQVLHRVFRTYQREIDAYIALTSFARHKFIEGGLPPELLHVKPNFLDEDPGVGSGGGGYALFIGRLTPEKGIRTLLKAWENPGHALPLKILGHGPLAPEVEAAARLSPGIEWLGQRPRSEVMRLAGEAECLVFPSEWYEGFPMTIVEAFAVGLPVIASRVGALPEIVESGRTGLHFAPGDAESLKAAVGSMTTEKRALWSAGARAEFEHRYTRPQNILELMSIYHTALQRKGH
ncbi:glycosyltransferase family 4 protein [Deinococcus koreensis]|uniref:Glycosyl transferase family 1 n=1 Tax=Deinococcus koreensis TaxID=2054903 RepID=A0A2K3UTB6_9DEIO|nr:glycosyltransferase family 4 protein [Deinococcus koreensis]PNY79785.1 glycosyl transferase family 1 [Deinococcus koreensis]